MKKILIADDSSTFRQQLSGDLEEQGYEVVQAEDGQDAIDKIKGTDGINLVILDVNMPKASGIEVLETVQPLSSIVFMLTTDSSADLKEKGKALGVKAWITKPYNKDNLMMALKKVLG